MAHPRIVSPNHVSDDDLLLTTADVSRLLGRTSDTIRQMGRAGRLPAILTLSGQRLYRMGDVRRHLVEREEREHEAVARG
jgi:predicted site-specific integrase-resolvase